MVKFDALPPKIEEKEVTAYVQQQLAELSPHLSPDSSVQVNITQGPEGFEAEVTLFQEEGDIQTVGRNKDPYQAIRYAKEGLVDYFIEVEDQLHPLEREAKINHFSRHGNLYLH